MDDKKEKTDESVSRRSFLTSLGKWSSIVVVTAVLGIPEASGSVDGPKEEREPGAAREGVPGHSDGHDESAEPQWRRRIWGNGGGAGCRVWGNAPTCRVWGNR